MQQTTDDRRHPKEHSRSVTPCRGSLLEGEERQRQSSRESLVKEDEEGEGHSLQHVEDHREEGAPERTLQCDTFGVRSRIVVEEGIGASVALYVSVSGFCNMVDSKKRVKGWRTQEQMKKHNSNRNTNVDGR